MTLSLALASETSKPTSCDILPPTRPHLLQQGHPSNNATPCEPMRAIFIQTTTVLFILLVFPIQICLPLFCLIIFHSYCLETCLCSVAAVIDSF